MKRVAIITSVVCLFVTLFAACKHEIPLAATTNTHVTPTPPVNPTGPGGTGSTMVCFETDILPIFQTNCAKSGCHSAASHQKDYVLDSYNHIISRGVNAGNASESKIYRVLFETSPDKKMPQPPNADLTAAQKALIGKWINEGAQNTTNCSSSTGCDTANFKFNADIKPILASNCTGCHGGTAPTGGINLTDYTIVKQVALNGRLIGAVTHTLGYQPMPQNANKLSDYKIIQIKKWATAGALYN